MPEHFKVVRIPRKALYKCLALLATQPGHPSVHMRNEYWPWSRPLPGKKRQVLRNNSPPPVPQDCWHTELTALDIICASLAANVRHISIIAFNRLRLACAKLSPLKKVEIYLHAKFQ